MRTNRRNEKRRIYKGLKLLSNDFSELQTEFNKFLIKDAIQNRKIDKDMIIIGICGNIGLHLIKNLLDVKVVPQFAPTFK